jgi:hypothetical protein
LMRLFVWCAAPCVQPNLAFKVRHLILPAPSFPIIINYQALTVVRPQFSNSLLQRFQYGI